MPLLLLHGDQDTTVPIVVSQQAFAELHGTGGSSPSTAPATSACSSRRGVSVLDDSAVSFLDFELKGDARPAMGLSSRIRASGVATLQRGS